MALSREKLSAESVHKHLSTLKDWSIEENQLTKVFEFDAYKSGLVFASAVGWIADGLDHHPDIIIGYRKVTIKTMTHDSDGITEYDFALAKLIDAL